MRPSSSHARDYPEYEDEEKQEAARFLCSEFENVDGRVTTEDFHAVPMIDGITDIERLNKWTEVKKDLGSRVEKADREALRRRRRELTVEEDVEFTPASETEAGADAVADGGAVVDEADADEGEESDAPNDGVSPNDDWEIGPDQEPMEYADEAEKQSKKNEKRRTVWDLVNTVEEAEDALDRQYRKDVVPIHTVELLEERLEELQE